MANEQLWRVSIGMQQREVWADGPFDAAHSCGLGSGDLMRTEVEVLKGDEQWPTGYRGGFHVEPKGVS
jgi:hypothetical protein